MGKEIEAAIKEYQCIGCIDGPYPKCFKKDDSLNIGCAKQVAGTVIAPTVGYVFLGMPKGFNRLGYQKRMRIHIYETLDDAKKDWKNYDHCNMSCWKYRNDKGHIFIRGFQPRLNVGFVHVILDGKDYNKIKAYEVDITTID